MEYQRALTIMRESSVKELRWALLGLLSLLFIGALCIGTIAEFGWVILMLEKNQKVIFAVAIAIIVCLIFDRK